MQDIAKQIEFTVEQLEESEQSILSQATHIEDLNREREASAASHAALEGQLERARQTIVALEARIAEEQTKLEAMAKQMSSSRWLFKAMVAKVARAPQDIFRRGHRSMKKRHGELAAPVPLASVSSFAFSQLRHVRYRKYLTSSMVLLLGPALPRSFSKRMRNRMEKNAYLTRNAPPVVADTKKQAVIERKSDLISFINFEYGDESSRIVRDLIDNHFVQCSAAQLLPRELTPELAIRWGQEIRTYCDKHSGADKPTVSIIIPIHNQIVFTIGCINSIIEFGSKYIFEILIGDDCSTDKGVDVLAECHSSIKYIRHAKNQGFLHNCNLTAEHATGDYIVFLNNDTLVLPGWLDGLIDTLRQNNDIGLVGSRLVYPDGRLQEAGGIIFSDGSGQNFGRGGHPSDPRYAHMRDVDYVSGASIAMPTHLWRHLGGFDPRYSPAYYEDTDLAFRIREEYGLRVVYQAVSTLIHFEGISHGTNITSGTKRFQEVNRDKFKTRWADVLPTSGNANSYPPPTDRKCFGRVLVIDAETPFPDRDSGSLDAFNYMKILRRMGYHVAFSSEHQSWDGRYSQDLRAIGVEVLFKPFWSSIEDILKAQGSALDFVFLYRAPIAKKFVRLVRQYAPNAKIIFDTVDLHFLRIERQAILNDCAKLAEKASIMREIELEVVCHCDATIVLSSYEDELLRQLVPHAAIYQVPLVRDIAPLGDTPFEKRNDVVFIGGFRHPPNIDAVEWFVKKVWPLVRAKGVKARLVIVGSDVPPEIQSLADTDVEVRGFVADLAEVFSTCRLSVAPLRYGAGLKGKVVSCLSYGLPVVGSSVAVEGSGLVDDVHVLVADDPDIMASDIARLYDDVALWQRLSTAGYSFAVENFSLTAVEARLRDLMSDLNRAPIAPHG